MSSLRPRVYARAEDCVRSGRASAFVVRALALGVSMSVAGCASDEEYRRKVYGDPQQQMAMRGPMPERRVEMEDDGLPSQVAPPLRRKIEADDPSEPYSPNYGKVSPQPARAEERQPSVSPANTTPAPSPAFTRPSPSAQQAWRPAPSTGVPAVAGWRYVAR